MAVKLVIGHASISEHNTTQGTAGDQTGKEVYIIKDYSLSGLSPTVVLRPKSSELAEKSARACEAGCRNENIGYSWYGDRDRNTLYLEAKKVNFDLSKITKENACNTDCSAFMSVCALAGGATFKYGYNLGNGVLNGPTTSTMRSWFTQNGEYEALTARAYLTNAGYLKRGDILVNEDQHTVMVLSIDGANYSEAAPSTSDVLTTFNFDDLEAKSVELKLSSIETSKVHVEGTVLALSKSKIKELKDAKFIKSYEWKYNLAQLDNKNKQLNKKLKVTKSPFSFDISGLTPNKHYLLQVIATKDDLKINSQKILFNTTLLRPASAEKVVAKFSDKNFNKNSTCTLSFSDTNSQTGVGYRISLVVNGDVKYYSDDLVISAPSDRAIKFSIKTLTAGVNIDYNDTIQIGVQTWLKNNQDELILDSDFPKCSSPVQAKCLLPIVNKIFIKIKDKFNCVIAYNNTK